MPCCCTNTLDLGCIGTCNEDFLKTGNLATLTGDYKLYVEFHSAIYRMFNLIVEGDEIQFPTSNLNESYEYTGYIVDPAGNFISLSANGQEYDCISFRTMREFALNESTAS